MNEKTKNRIIECANFIIENEATNKQTQEKFNLSKSTIKKYINDEDKLQEIDYELYLKVKQVQEQIEKISREKGGRLSSRKNVFKNSNEEILLIANEMISKKLTLEEAAIIYGIPKSTIHERLNSIKDYKILSDLKQLFEDNKSNAFNNLKEKKN